MNTDIQTLLDTGIIIIDKPPGPTSHEVSSWVKKILHTKKSGHAGTLDPNVTGVLPVALNRATRLLPYITKDKKSYVGILKFSKQINKDAIISLFNLFTGRIIQLPPKMSAVRRRQRIKNIDNIKLIEIKDKRVLFQADVEAGTYIRAIARDISYMIGNCQLEELRRIKVGSIDEGYAVKLQDLVDAYWLFENKGDDSELCKMIHPIEEFINIPKIIVKNNAVEQLAHGSPLFIPGVKEFENFEKDKEIILFTESGRMIGIHKTVVSSEEIKKINKGMLSKPIIIILPP
ncbi:RNA-guided pseudouridylation complex pseudouridine synthase subunit Cbf5 [Candidatus Micrarchaeota archaeon]|nr:RNA-guided pseudouridylation complex pseudouridine synthase subunit Cbf5 [Candidatus Micrarchaeota archaeon]